MKFGLWTANGALNSKPVFEAFAIGVQKLGHKVIVNKEADIEVIWSVLWNGRMRKNEEIWNRCKKQGKPIIVLEIGCFYRGRTWKMGVNGVNRDAYFANETCDNSRLKKLNLNNKEWKLNDGKILIAGQHLKSGQWKNYDQAISFVDNTINEIRKFTDNAIIYRPHPRSKIHFDISKYQNVDIQQPIKNPNTYDDYNLHFENISAVVNYSSNPGVIAAIEGIPTFVSQSSLAYEVSNPISKINYPDTPDKMQWLNNLSYTEWFLDEISTGYPILRLTSYWK